MKFPALIALSLAFALPAFAQGPGGGGGFNPGGGGGSSGSFTYDSIQSNVTNADATVSRNGLLFARPDILASIAPPSSVTAIADGLFAGCITLVTADLSSTAITALPSDCFAGCTALTTVVLPDTCTAIGPNAFAGCTALSSVTAPAVATVASDAFRGCTSLSALPATRSTLGDYAFAQSGLLSVNANGLALAPGAFAGCTVLASLQNAPDTLPDALCSGCTALDFPDLAGKTLGTAALAGIPTAAFTVNSATTLGEASLAASEAPLETTLTLSDDALPAYASTAFLGRSVGFTPTGTSDTAPLQAFHLVSWLHEQATSESPLVDQPESYNTDDLETWLVQPGNAQTYASAFDADLTVSGNTFLYTPPAAKNVSVLVTLESTANLLDAASWTPDALDLVSTDESGVQTYTTTNSPAFARLAFSPAW